MILSVFGVDHAAYGKSLCSVGRVGLLSFTVACGSAITSGEVAMLKDVRLITKTGTGTGRRI